MSFITQFKIELLLQFMGCRKVFGKMPVFDINESTVQGIINAHNFPGAGRLLTYPIELNDELLRLIFVLRNLNFPVSAMCLKEKAKLVIQPHNQSLMQAEVGLENFSTSTNLPYMPVL